MSNDQNGNGSGGGGGGVRYGETGFDDSEEPTVVVVPRSFLIGSLGRAASALHGAGDVCLDSRALVTAGAGAAALADLIEELEDLATIVEGMARALKRLTFEEEEIPK